jgi:Protein of unknown function (DUF3515)
VTVPLVVIIGLALGLAGGGGPDSTKNPTTGSLPAITVAAPPNGTAESDSCTKVLEQLPVQLQVGKQTLSPRVVHTTPDSPFVVAWGDPAVVLSCGAARPKDLHAGSSADFVSAGPETGPFYDVTSSDGADVFTTVDRAAYVAVTIPGKYQGSSVMPPLSDAIAHALPTPVCSTDPQTPNPDDLCDRRA